VRAFLQAVPSISQRCPHLRRRSAWPSGSIATLLAAAALLLVSNTGQLAQTTAPTQAAATEGKVPRKGFDLYYTIGGTNGPYALILSGGPGEEIRSMQGVADELSKRYRCIMLQQRGTGRSKLSKCDPSTINLNAYIEDIEALRKHLQIDKLILVGNSWGMMLALAYGGTYPDHVRAIVTIGSGPITTDYLAVMIENMKSRLCPSDMEVIEYWTEPSRHAADFERAEFERVRATAPAYFYDRKAGLQYGKELAPDEFNPYVAPAFKAGGAFDLRPKLKAITAPVLLLQGRQDIAGEANIDEAHLLISNSVLKFINKCGHMPWLEQPEQTWKIVNEFLDSLPR
jgi:proline iminopeptidase